MQALSIPCSVNLIGITSALCELVMRYNAMTPSLSHGIGTYDIVWTILDYKLANASVYVTTETFASKTLVYV